MKMWHIYRMEFYLATKKNKITFRKMDESGKYGIK